jgi:hypothetical protein
MLPGVLGSKVITLLDNPQLSQGIQGDPAYVKAELIILFVSGGTH